MAKTKKKSAKKKVTKKTATKKVATKKATKKAAKKKATKKAVSKGPKIKVGVFGGTFNPIHYGHLNSIETVCEKLNFDKMVIVPNFQNPLRAKVEGPTPMERLEMVELVLPTLNQNEEKFEVSDIEVQNENPSYTIETLKELKKEMPNADLHLIIGADQLYQFDQWKDFEGILKIANLVVTSRPGSKLPLFKDDLPTWIADRLKNFRGLGGTFKSGTKLFFVKLKDLEISSTEIRNRIRRGADVSQYTPTLISDYAKGHEIYNRLGAKISDYERLTEFCAELLKEKGGLNVMGFDVRHLDQASEYTLVSSGTSTRHTLALAEHLSQAVRDEFSVYPQAREGMQEARWIVLDYGQLIVHLFYDYVRSEYNIENLWEKGHRLNL